MIKFKIEDELGRYDLHIEGHSITAMLLFEPKTDLETGEIWLTKEKVGRLSEILDDIYNEMDDEENLIHDFKIPKGVLSND